MTSQPAIDPRVAQDEAARGRALLRAGRNAAALTAFGRAAWLAPDDPRIQWALENLPAMRQDLAWLASVYPAVPQIACRKALAIFAAEDGRG